MVNQDDSAPEIMAQARGLSVVSSRFHARIYII